jgi:hypothetical protein
MWPFDRLHADLLQRVGECHQRVGVVVELGAVLEPAGPGEDRGDGVGRGLLALLVLAVVARDGAVRGLGLHVLPSGVISTEVIRPSEPKPCATVSDCTSPS